MAEIEMFQYRKPETETCFKDGTNQLGDQRCSSVLMHNASTASTRKIKSLYGYIQIFLFGFFFFPERILKEEAFIVVALKHDS